MVRSVRQRVKVHKVKVKQVKEGHSPPVPHHGQGHHPHYPGPPPRRAGKDRPMVILWALNRIPGLHLWAPRWGVPEHDQEAPRKPPGWLLRHQHLCSCATTPPRLTTSTH